MSKTLTYILFIFIQLSLTQGEQKCSLDDSPCVRARASSLWKLIANGIPELGIKNSDKLYLRNVTLPIDKITFEMFNLEIGGLNDLVVDSFRIDTRLKYIHIFWHTTLIQQFDYNLGGTLFSLALSGSGTSTVVRKNVRINAIMNYDIIKDDNGKDVMELKHYYFGSDTNGGVTYNFSNVTGDLNTDHFNEFLKENWLLMSQKYAAQLVEVIVDHVYNAAKIYIEKRPLEDVF